MVNSVPPELMEAIARDAEHLALIRRVGLVSYIVAPAIARGRTLGVVSLIGTEAGRHFGPADRELAEELACRIGQAIDNAALYREAQAARQRAEEAGRSKDLFLAMLSHELRTPLTPILAVVSARLQCGLSPQLQSELEMIHRNVLLEARLIDDLLDLARIERGQLRLDREVTDVHQAIHQALEICHDEVTTAGLGVILDLSAPSHHVEADPARLMQVAWNLIHNATVFTPAGGTLTIRTHNGRGDRESTPSLIVEFKDTGQGIEPELIPRIFDAFELGRPDLPRRSGGLGLGLAISRSVIEAHGASLTVRSPGKGLGSTFRLELATVTPVAPAAEVPPPPASREPCRSLRILLVEDNRDTLRFLAKILSERGHEVHAAVHLAAARAETASVHFDLVISDIELPDGTGLTLMRELARVGVVGIAMSGFGSDEDVRESLKAGFAEHLTKPVVFAKLEEAIERLAFSASTEPLAK